MATATPRLSELDVSDPALFEKDEYHPLFARLREEAPVHFCSHSSYGPYWSITRYDDVVEVEKNHEVFSSDYDRGGITIRDATESSDIVRGSSFITKDPPRHTAHRGMVKPAFTAANLRELEAEIRQRVVDILEPLPRGVEFDWVERVANELPIQMLATLFGVPQVDRHRLLRWSNVIIGLEDPEVVQSREQAVAEMQEFGEYFLWLLQQRKESAAGHDLVSLLAHSPTSRDLPPEEYLGTIALLVVGGNDTTRNSITGGLHALMENPLQYEKLRADRSLIPSAVSEMIRWVSPVAHMRRTATADYTLRGETIREGEKVILWYCSANRDADAFDEPDSFLVERRGPRHLSFGVGIHFCIGARLAEMQLRCLWEELLVRYPRIERAGEPRRLYSNFISGFKSLPVRIADE